MFACDTGQVANTAPIAGAVLKVAPDSVHPPVIGAKSIAPETVTLSTKTVSVALVMLDGLVAGGTAERSNFMSAVPPPPALSATEPPKFVAGRFELSQVSAETIPCCA